MTKAGAKIIAGLSEASRVATLIRAVVDVGGRELTEQEAVQVLAALDAVDPLRAVSSDAVPEPQAGQVWRSPKPKTPPRHVSRIATHRTWNGLRVYFRLTGDTRERSVSPASWRSWARKSGARPG